MAAACGGELSATAIAGDGPLRAAAATAGQVVVTTPAKAAQALREGVLTARMLEERLQVGGAAAVNTLLLHCVAMHSFTLRTGAAPLAAKSHRLPAAVLLAPFCRCWSLTRLTCWQTEYLLTSCMCYS